LLTRDALQNMGSMPTTTRFSEFSDPFRIKQLGKISRTGRLKGNSEGVMLPSGSSNSNTHALRVEAAGAFPHPLSPDLVLGCEVC
jgi:hypothetical protein